MPRALTLALIVLILPVVASSQTGLPPFGSIDQIGLEYRNNQNLNVLLAIPIMSSPGRGLNLNFSLVYNSTNWSDTYGAWGFNPGWATAFTSGNITYQYITTQNPCNRVQGLVIYYYQYKNYIYVDPIGTSHPLPLSWLQTYNQCTNQTTTTGTFSGYATDGSGYLAGISKSYPANPGVISSAGITFGGNGTLIQDPNGNYMSSTTNGSETDWYDSTGRKALKTISGTSTIQYEFLEPTTGNYATTTLNLQTLNIKSNFQCSGIIEYSYTASLPSTLVLPNGQTYSFTYEPTPGNSGYYTGRLQRVTFPTGGYHEFDYTGPNDGVNCADGTTLSMNRVVSDGANTATWSYVRSTANHTTTITTPKLVDTTQANDMIVYFNNSNQEVDRQIFANSPGSGTPLRTINTTWATNGTPATQTIVLDDGSTQSKVATTYDSNGLLDSVSEYGFGTGAPGSLFRTTNYTYQTSTNYTNLNLINLVISKQILNGSGTVQYRQDTTYDATSGDNQSCPTGIPQHFDANYGCTFYYRGNPTSVITYLAPATQGSPITKDFTYDFFGNLLTAQLNCCQIKTWGYSSASTTNEYSVPDSITTGSSPSLKTTYQYDAYSSQVTSTTDPNGLVTSFSYDYLRRPTNVSQTNGPSASVSYNDTTVPFSSTTTAVINSSSSTQQITALDTLGRPNLRTTEDASNNVYAKVSANYDLVDRAYQTSNPYISASPSYWTTTAFDVLGRPISATLQDGSATNFTYSTYTTTIKDPAGNQRESLADAAGRLVTVYEPDPTNNNSLTLQTSYAYSILDELTQIAQGSQTRSYVYDALGRLNSATTPEAGTVCFGTVSGGACQANGYDSYDNLLYRTDARGVVTSYGYDGLNRLTGVSYNVSGASGVPATASLSYNYGNSSSCNSTNGPGCIGQLISMTDGVGSETYTYNGLEQLSQLQKVINGSTYTTSYAYNLAGELTQITYPSGRVVQRSVDAIGRLCEIAPATTGCGTATNPYATGFGFSAAGQVTGFKYGNGLYASFGFAPDRLALNCLDYSTTNRSGSCTHDSTTKFGLNYSYPTAPGNNGLFSGITDSVDSGRNVSYTYDSLYRLLNASTSGSTNYPAWDLQQGYDRYGNRNTQTILSGCTGITCPTFSATASTTTNHLPSPYTYDLSGNFTYDGSNTLVYDGENHATSATNSGTSGAYVYDGAGHRVQKCIPNCTSPTTNTTYVFSGSKVIAEYSGGSPSREYVYSGAQLVAAMGPDAPNGGFESGLTGWTILDGNVSLISNASNAHSGTNYVQISTNPGGSSDIMISPPVAVELGDQVTFGGWAYLQSGSGGAEGWWIETQDSNHNALNWIGAGSAASSANWVFQSGAYTIPSGVAYVALYATSYMPTTATVLRVDDGYLLANPRYYHQDHLSNRLVTDLNGNILEQLGHFPFGESWYDGSGEKLLFTTYERDSESGNDYALARQDVNRLARFSSPDPLNGGIADPQSLNRYAYALNNPCNLTDPLGTCTITIGVGPEGLPTGAAARIKAIFNAAGVDVDFVSSNEHSNFLIWQNVPLQPSPNQPPGTTVYGDASSGIALINNTSITQAVNSVNLRLLVLGANPLNAGPAIGTVMSHELGHLILGCAHGDPLCGGGGLMRQGMELGATQFLDPKLQLDPTALQFTAAQAQAIQNRCHHLRNYDSGHPNAPHGGGGGGGGVSGGGDGPWEVGDQSGLPDQGGGGATVVCIKVGGIPSGCTLRPVS